MSDDNAPEDGKQPARCKMNFACSIALSTAQIFAGVGPVVSRVANLRADRIVAANKMAYFLSSVMRFPHVVVCG